ncbi:MAG: hypothetical protein IK016_00010 [Lachnospiraceae bacterium]|nr:hypothetical protein [Lachnospiraceae bacterium]
MKRNKEWKKWIWLALFLAAGTFVVHRVYRVLSWKDTMAAYLSNAESFYHTEDGLIDVAVFGTSHGYAAVRPDVIWDEYGYSVFNFSVSGQDKISTIHYIRELLDRHTPQVLFVDIYATPYERAGVLSNLYRNMLSLKYSQNSIAQVSNYFTEEDEERMDFYLRWPIIHTRYRELKPYDFYDSPANRYGRGAVYLFMTGVADFSGTFSHEREKKELSESNRLFVDRLAEIRDEYNVTIIPILLPCVVYEDEQPVFNGVLEYAEECGFTCIDFNLMLDELDLDVTRDFFDNTHLSGYGAVKMSRWIGAYLKEHFTLEDHRGDERFYQWEEDAQHYAHVEFREQLKEITGLSHLATGISETDDLLVVLVMTSGFGEQKNQLATLAPLLHLPEGFVENGGICVIDEGEVKIHTSLQTEDRYYFDMDEHHTVWAESAQQTDKNLMTGETDTRIVWRVGIDRETWYRTEESKGIEILIYDKRLEYVIDRRTIDYQSLYVN